MNYKIFMGIVLAVSIAAILLCIFIAIAIWFTDNTIVTKIVSSVYSIIGAGSIGVLSFMIFNL